MSHDPRNVHIPEMPLPPQPPPEDDGWDIDAVRRQVAEEIAAKADEIAQGYQDMANAHRDLSDRQTPQGQRHWRTALAARNKADGAWAVAHAAREIGGKA